MHMHQHEKLYAFMLSTQLQNNYVCIFTDSIIQVSCQCVNLAAVYAVSIHEETELIRAKGIVPLFFRLEPSNHCKLLQ